MLFATLAVAATALQSWVSYRGVSSALETEFVRRLQSLAGTIASQVSPEDVADVAQLGEESHAYAALQLLLEEMRATSQIANAAVLDTAGHVLYDCRNARIQGRLSPLDSIAPVAIDSARAGRPSVSRVYRWSGGLLRAGFAPVLDMGSRVAGVVAVEATMDHTRVLDGLRRDFALRTLITALLMTVLAVILLRMAWSSQQLERRLSRAENLASMGRLTATLAHEIKNPLAIIRGSAERLGKLEPEARRMAEYVTEECDRLSHTVARYLQFARGETGLSAAEPAATAAGDAYETLGATLALLEGELRTRRVSLRPELAPGAAPVSLDNESLKQVYLNLILNALDAMPEGGTLSVTSGERAGRIEVRIEDTGAGIPPEVLKKLSQPFFTTRAQGTGLGLFLARRLVESAGGQLTLESEVGRGTACTLRFPHRRG